ncbi:MAG: pyridoxal-phosphate dependent enzyme, partial [Paracoccaceae bacterium]|nr:pyridoxal-phosphate dependent enzyme [Paracoccaceae bacterium]
MQEQPLSSVLDAMQQSPLVRLDRLTRAHGVKGTILAKLDYLLPGSSKKDRAAKGLIEAAEVNGNLHKGQTVVELTSGNMGTSLAIVCALKGYPFVAVMSQGNSPERARMMQALGAEVVLVAQSAGGISGQVSGKDLALVEQATQQLTRERAAFRADQFTLVGNWQAHFHTTGPEIYTQSGRHLSGFVDFIGSGGTYAGVTKALKQRNPKIKCYIVEPEGAAILAGKPVTASAHPIQGGGYSIDTLDFLSDTP